MSAYRLQKLKDHILSENKVSAVLKELNAEINSFKLHKLLLSAHIFFFIYLM